MKETGKHRVEGDEMMGCENLISSGFVAAWMWTLGLASLGGFVSALIAVRCTVGLLDSLRSRPIEILGS